MDDIDELIFLYYILTIDGKFLKEDICNSFPEVESNYIEKLLKRYVDSGLIDKTESYYFSL